MRTADVQALFADLQPTLPRDPALAAAVLAKVAAILDRAGRPIPELASFATAGNRGDAAAPAPAPMTRSPSSPPSRRPVHRKAALPTARHPPASRRIGGRSIEGSLP